MCTILRPPQESISRRRCSRQGAGLPVVVCSLPGNYATIARISGGIDGEALELEMSHIVCRFCHGEGKAGTRRDLISVLGPIDEVVAGGGSSRQGASLPVVVCSLPRNYATTARISGGIDTEVLELEMSHIVCLKLWSRKCATYSDISSVTVKEKLGLDET